MQLSTVELSHCSIVPRLHRLDVNKILKHFIFDLVELSLITVNFFIKNVDSVKFLQNFLILSLLFSLIHPQYDANF